MNNREELCPGSGTSGAQERLRELQSRQEPILAKKSKFREDVLKMVNRGATKFKMGTQTIHLAMTYFDIYHNQYLEDSEKPWQLHAITCLILACKFQERDDNVPLISEVIKYLVT